MAENWPKWFANRPKWLEAMERLETEYGTPALDRATEQFREMWPQLQWENPDIGDRPLRS